jgi:hypothetical protein
MTELTPNPLHDIPPVQPADLLRRIAAPFFLFSLVLTTLLLLSWFLLLPRFTHVAVNGSLADAPELAAYRSSLQAQISAQEEKRDSFVLPFHDADYENLKAAKIDEPLFPTIWNDVRQVANGLNPTPDAIHFDRVSFDQAKNVVTLDGDVRFVGPRSMTLLAAFTESLKGIPSVSSVDLPSYRRSDDPGLGLHSPFTIVLHLP